MNLFPVTDDDMDMDEEHDFKRITKAGGSRTLAITKHLPVDWETVALDSRIVDADTVLIRVRRVK